MVTLNDCFELFKKLDKELYYISIYTNGSGDVFNGCGSVQYAFDSIQGLHEWLTEQTKPFITLDGVEYSESTLRSLIKKATK